MTDSVTTYYYVLASQHFLFEEEPFEEVLRERERNYQERGIEIDFWLVKDPAFVSTPEFADIKTQVPHPCVAIISTNSSFVTWLKLRLEYVYRGEFEAPSASIPDPLASAV